MQAASSSALTGPKVLLRTLKVFSMQNHGRSPRQGQPKQEVELTDLSQRALKLMKANQKTCLRPLAPIHGKLPWKQKLCLKGGQVFLSQRALESIRANQGTQKSRLIPLLRELPQQQKLLIMKMMLPRQTTRQEMEFQ